MKQSFLFFITLLLFNQLYSGEGFIWICCYCFNDEKPTFITNRIEKKITHDRATQTLHEHSQEIVIPKDKSSTQKFTTETTKAITHSINLGSSKNFSDEDLPNRMK